MSKYRNIILAASKHRNTVLLFLAAALAAGGVFLIRNLDNSKSQNTEISPKSLFPNPEMSSTQNLDTSSTRNLDISPSRNIDMSKYRLYTHPAYGFSFRYPEGFAVSAFEDGEGETVLVRGSSDKENFQIYITPFDEPGPITPERVKRDLPDMVIDQPKEIEISGVKMLAFLSDNNSLGRVREVWFVEKGNLYQVTAYADADVLISAVLETFKFGNQ